MDVVDYVIIPLSVNMSVYWSIIYINNKYRLNENINWLLYIKNMPSILTTQLIITPVFLYNMIPLWKWRGINNTYTFGLTIYDLLQIIVCSCIADFIFYHIHKLGHASYIYKCIHYKHHEWNVPYAIAAAHCHPIEYTLCLMPSLLIPPFILGVSLYVMVWWFAMATIYLVNSQSGYLRNSNIRRENEQDDEYATRLIGPIQLMDNLYGVENKDKTD